MLNKAYTRGVNDALRQAGIVKFANDELANEAADAVAEETLPEEMPEEIPPATTAELAANLAELADALAASADSAEQAAAIAAEAEADANADLEDAVNAIDAANAAKAASVKQAAAWLRRKLAEGSIITGKDPQQTNDQANSADNVAAVDAANRPGGEAYANVGVAGVGTQEASGVGAIGREGPAPKSMGPVASDGSNSAIEAVKNASLIEMIRKLAQTTYLPNAAPKADLQNDVAALDAANRPGGLSYANEGVDGVGDSSEAAKERASSIGTEQSHPGTMGPVGSSGTNSAIEQTAKSAAEKQYVANFKAVADKYAQFLPPRLSRNEKIAAIRYLMSRDPLSRDKIALHMSKTAELPAGLAEYVEKEKEKEESGESECEEKKEEAKGECEEKKEEKKDEEKSAAARALNKVRQLMR